MLPVQRTTHHSIVSLADYIHRMMAVPVHYTNIALDLCQGWTSALLITVCMGLVAVSLCAQSAQLKLPIVVYRQEQLSLHKVILLRRLWHCLN